MRSSPNRFVRSRSVVCYDCKVPGHIRRNCPQRSNSTYTCQNQDNRDTEQTELKGIGSRPNLLMPRMLFLLFSQVIGVRIRVHGIFQ